MHNLTLIAVFLFTFCASLAQGFILFFPDHIRPRDPEELTIFDIAAYENYGIRQPPRIATTTPVSPERVEEVPRSYIRRRSASNRANYMCPCRHKLCTIGNECPNY
ncbi:unnamed protein product [Caenorhabditis auriculariae]|uniref:Uncharacterized protein n=1 Tax=Caenorhabditis auriculariae TaxID=2777116 RepID=A0A8S1HT32_9PELO|nr:unnamed protein product [Caenorhabditis auriculariae]